MILRTAHLILEMSIYLTFAALWNFFLVASCCGDDNELALSGQLQLQIQSVEPSIPHPFYACEILSEE
jgi:hypothetical protein